MVIDRYLMEITVKVLTCYLEIIRRHVNLGFVDIIQVWRGQANFCDNSTGKYMEILPGVHQIKVRGSSVMLVVGQDVTLVDAGLSWSPNELNSYMRKAGLDIKDISRIIITHHHLDHAGGAAQLKRLTGAELAAHSADALYIAGAELYPSPFVSPVLGAIASPVINRLQPRQVAVDVSLEDGDNIGPFTVVHVPGHTMGSIALHDTARGFLMVGDALQNRFGRLSQPDRLFTVDMAQANRSIEKMARLDFEVLCFSHFAPIMHGGRQRLEELASRLVARTL